MTFTPRHANFFILLLFCTGLLLTPSPPAGAAVVVNKTALTSGSYIAPQKGQVTITITGADGGAGSTTRGGSGATVRGVYNVTAEQTIRYIVGKASASFTDTGVNGEGGGSTGVYINTTLVLVRVRPTISIRI